VVARVLLLMKAGGIGCLELACPSCRGLVKLVENIIGRLFNKQRGKQIGKLFSIDFH